MGLSFHCPKCRAAVPALPTQMGQQVVCPACQTQFRLSPAMLGGNGQSPAAKPAAAPVAAAAGSAPIAAPPIVSHPALAPGKTTVAETIAKQATPRWIGPAAVPPSPPSAPAQQALTGASVAPPPVVAPAALARPVAAPAPARPAAPQPAAPTPQPQPARPNVARFIAAESKDSAVQLTAEGKLPELALAEATGRKPKTTESSASPLVLGLALCASTIVSLLLVVYDFDGDQATTQEIETAHGQIARFYAAEDVPPRPYQELLRRAQRAHSEGDFAAERQFYHQVQALLRNESRDQFAFLTGSKGDDEELQRLLGILLKEGR